MGKLKPLSSRELCRILELHGFKVVRKKGSHISMQKITDTCSRTVIVPDHKEIRIGTLSSIIRQSGLERSLFE